MFRFFKFKKDKIPEFKKLNVSGIKNKYSYRIASWDWINKDLINVMDPKSPRIITMDAWPQLVFLESDGQKTIEELVFKLAKQYKKIPNELDEVILYQIEQLVTEGLIKLSDKKNELSTEFIGPIKN